MASQSRTSEDAPQGFELLTVHDVSRLVRRSVRTINRWVLEGDFPKPVVHRGGRYWKRSVIDDWIEQLFAEPGDSDSRERA